MPIYDMYPYTNLHELNLDWIIKVAKETQGALEDITTLVSDLSDLSDCLHAYPNFSPNPRLVCDYDLAVSGDIRASGHTVYTKDVIATGDISCDDMTASGDLTVSGTINGDLNGIASRAGAARVLCDSNWDAYNQVGGSTTPIYWNLGAPTACGTSLDVSITGNAATATSAISASSATTAQNAQQLKTARNFTLTGAVSGTVSSDLATDLSIATTQNIIKKISAQVNTASEIGLSGQTGVKAVGINGTDLDWADPTFDPDTKILLACEMLMSGSIVGVSHNWLSQHGLTMTVIGDQGFDIDDFSSAIIDLYYIDPIS